MVSEVGVVVPSVAVKSDEREKIEQESSSKLHCVRHFTYTWVSYILPYYFSKNGVRQVPHLATT